MELIKTLEQFFPRWALRRRQAESLERFYDAGTPSSQFKRVPGGNSSADAVVQQANISLRQIGRYLDENEPLAHGILDTLEKKVIGTGLELRPMVKSSTGKVQERLNKRITDLWWEFSQSPEVTRELTMDEVQRVSFRSMCRDGEMLAQHVVGDMKIRPTSQVYYAVELLEADFLPFNTYVTTGTRQEIISSVEKNQWGKPIAYHLYKTHPGSGAGGYLTQQDQETKRVLAEDMVHLKYTTRIRQTRGVPILAPILRLMESIKDYKESETVAARVNAALTAFITKSTDFAGATGTDSTRAYEMNPGMIYTDLLPGEDVSMIKADRPNPELTNFLNILMRSASSGTHTSYSDISKDYSGTYSSQRQEMVSQKIDYDLLRGKFINDFMNPIYRKFLEVAQLQSLLKIPQSVDMKTLLSPEWSTPAQPWIDPKKEADAWIAMHDAGLMSKAEIVGSRGADLNKLYTELSMEKEMEDKLGLTPEEPQTQEEPVAKPDDEQAA